MVVQLTEKAAAEIKRTMTDQKMDADMLLRVAVEGGGCSGFKYSLKLDKLVDEKLDSKSEQFGLGVVVDRKSALFLDGTVIDYHEDINQRGFTFENPNAVKSCGCGSSFQA